MLSIMLVPETTGSCNAAMNNGIGYNGGRVTSLACSTFNMAGLAKRFHQHC